MIVAEAVNIITTSKHAILILALLSDNAMFYHRKSTLVSQLWIAVQQTMDPVFCFLF